MFRSRIATGLLIAVSVLINCDKTGCQPQPEQLLETLTTMTTSPLSEESTIIHLEQRCAGYERIIRTFLPADQQATVSKDELYAHVISQAERKQSLNAQEERVVDDIRQCIVSIPNLMRSTASTPALAPTLAPESDYDTGMHSGKQQNRAEQPTFDKEGLSTLSSLNYESRTETRAERCNLFDGTLRSIYNRTRPELVNASTPAVYEAAIKGLESRNLPALVALEECVQNTDREQAPSSINDDNEERLVYSKLSQLEQTQEQLIEQHVSNSDLIRRLESDLARETSRALEKERDIDEFQRRVARKAGKKALNKLRSKFESFKQDVSRLMTDYLNVGFNIETEQRKVVQLIYKRVGEFKSLMEIQLEKASDKIDALQAKQEEKNQQYVAIKEGFSKLEFEFETFKQSLATTFSESVYGNTIRNFDIIRLFYQQLEQFHVLLRGQLDTVLNDVFAKNTEQAHTSKQLETKTRQDPMQPKQLDIFSKLAQIELTQEHSMEQRSSELLKQRESALERETSRASEMEQEIVRFQRRASKEASLGALSLLKLESKDLKHDLARFVAQVDSIDHPPALSKLVREPKQSDYAIMIIDRVDRFCRKWRIQFRLVSYIIDALTAKQNQESEQYGPIRKALSDLESESNFEQFKRDLANGHGFMSVISIMKQMEEFLAALNGKLDMISSYIVAVDSKQVQGGGLRMLENRQSQEQPHLQHLDINSRLAQLEQGQEQLMKQHAIDSELSRQLESDLVRETSRASEKERKIDEFEWKVFGEEGRKALSELRFKFADFKQKVSSPMTNYKNFFDDRSVDAQVRSTRLRDQCNLMIGQVDGFKIVMREQFDKVLSNMETLKGKRELEDGQYVTIKEGFKKLEPELEVFKKSLDELFRHSTSPSRLDLAKLTDAGLERFYEALKRQLDAVSEYSGYYKRS